jgi:hypothetical protein
MPRAFIRAPKLPLDLRSDFWDVISGSDFEALISRLLGFPLLQSAGSQGVSPASRIS